LTKEYTFKKYKLSDVERIWLGELYKHNFTTIDARSLKVELWDQLPKNFDPKSIDRRFTIGNRLTLLGIWYFDQKNKMFEYVSQVITSLRDSIIGHTEIKEIKAIDIYMTVNIHVRLIEIALELIHDFGGFFSSATYSAEKSGLRSVTFGDGDDAYDRYLDYVCIDDLLEGFFIQNAPSTSTDYVESRIFSSSLLTPEIQKPDVKVWDEIKKDHQIGKRTFGKKINFIKDKYKRSIIFRDIEQAYTLAKFGYRKPAAILAGGVIEELLRLYLDSKKIEYKGDNFINIIEACKGHNMFKKSTGSLSDSVRYIRNLVHLSNENIRKDAITQSAAIAAVASVFAIVNDF